MTFQSSDLLSLYPTFPDLLEAIKIDMQIPPGDSENLFHDDLLFFVTDLHTNGDAYALHFSNISEDDGLAKAHRKVEQIVSANLKHLYGSMYDEFVLEQAESLINDSVKIYAPVFV